jgi:hypothetical protein
MEIIAKIVDQQATPAESADRIEVWATDKVSVRDHMILGAVLKDFCSALHPTQNHHFELRAIREAAVVGFGQVRFGAVLLATTNVFNDGEIRDLKRGCSEIIDKIRPVRLENAPQILDEIQEPEVAPALQQKVFEDFEDKFGGHRLSRALDIEIPQNARLAIAGQILQAPDAPVDDLPLEFLGMVSKIDFETQRVLIGINPGAGDVLPRITKTWAGCTSAELFELCTNAGLARAPLHVNIRRVPGIDGRLKDELERAELLLEGNGAPLIP